MTATKTAILLAATTALAGCVSDPRAYETEPVQLRTSKGIVTCQLYTREQVLWDRSINRPNNMSVEEADTICRNEGHRLQKLS